MSSAATLTIDPDEHGITRADWDEFAVEHNLEFSPRSVSGNLWYRGEVECSYGDAVGTDPLPDVVHTLRFSTFSVHVGGNIAPVVELLLAAWDRWPSAGVTADPEIVNALAHTAR